MPPFEKHLFVCLHERPDGEPRGSCAKKGSESLLKVFKSEVKKQGLAGNIRAQKAGCLDNCEQGCSVVVYPEGVWYGHVTEADVAEIVTSHLKEGKPVERLRLFGEKKG
ncbi:MAG: (2Fe-2S) ferredoxin domain-containing protein [Deltaproteobacteria bacterium]|nr:(2Fe-2S) ferredoxin domain-containing protein [Deltaproteobacteria bacterium]